MKINRYESKIRDSQQQGKNVVLGKKDFKNIPQNQKLTKKGQRGSI